MRYTVIPSTQRPGKWRVATGRPSRHGHVACTKTIYNTREEAEIACALLNLASE